MTQITVPFGPLVSFGATGHLFTFQANRSKLLPNWTLSAPTTRGRVLGQARTFDRFGKTRVPLEYALSWEYLVKGCPTAASAQGEFDLLLAVWEYSDVGTLSVTHYADSAGTATGTARLESITETSGNPVFKRVTLQFYVPDGMLI